MTEFRKMRRHKQELPEDICRNILRQNTSGVLSLLDESGYTYGVPLSYHLMGDTIYFHGAKEGMKIDAIRNHEKVSFTVVDFDDVQKEKYTTYFQSVIVFGKVRIVESEDEIFQAIRELGRKYNPEGTEEQLENMVTKYVHGMHMIALDIVHMTGKERK